MSWRITTNVKIAQETPGVCDRHLDIPTSPHLDAVLQKLHDKGHKALIVGGAVRDAMLGEKPKDVDVEVYGTNYDELADTLKPHGKVNLVGKAFGVVKFTDHDKNDYDFSLPRRDNKTGIGHKDFETEFDPDITPREAASRRDFTFNALAYDPVEHKLHDYFGGEEDLKNKTIRHTSEAFAEDPLRVLRGMQFSARYGMDVHPDTAKLAQSIKHEYPTIPKERVGEEFMKLATKGKEPGRAIDYLQKTGWHENFPALHALHGLPQDKEWHPEGDVATHTAHSMNAAAKIADREGLQGDDRAVTVFGAMCHDMGKPSTTKFWPWGPHVDVDSDPERVEYLRQHDAIGKPAITSHGHDQAGGPIARQFLDQIGIKPDITNRVVPLVERHMQHLNYEDGISSRTVRRLAERLHPAKIKELGHVMEADHSGRPPLPGGMPEGAQKMLAKASESHVVEKKIEPLIKGRDILPYFDGKPGPHIGEHVKAAYQAQLDGEINTPDEAQAWLRDRMTKTSGLPATPPPEEVPDEAIEMVDPNKLIPFAQDTVNWDDVRKITGPIREPVILTKGKGLRIEDGHHRTYNAAYRCIQVPAAVWNMNKRAWEKPSQHIDLNPEPPPKTSAKTRTIRMDLYRSYRAALREADEAGPEGHLATIGRPGQHPADSTTRAVARDYMASQSMPYDDSGEDEFAPVDETRGKRIAEAFEDAPHNPQHPTVVAAYEAFKHETRKQYDHLKSHGYEMTPWAGEGQPYKNSAQFTADVRNNRSIKYFKTVNPDEVSFGAESGGDPKDNPLLEDADRPATDTQGHTYHQTFNDLFRAVHDIYGHAKEGNQTGPRGEENAWRQHARMYSPLARRAMTTETRGQNSFVNFGRHLRRPDDSLPAKGEPDYVDLPDRPYADQKVTLLPPEFSELHHPQDNQRVASQERIGMGAAGDLPDLTYRHVRRRDDWCTDEDHDIHNYLRAWDGKKEVGYMRWAADCEGQGPYIEGLTVHEDYQRKGVATEMFRRAKEITPDLQHSYNLSPDARKWVRSMPKDSAKEEVYYHNSPRENRESIRANGIMPFGTGGAGETHQKDKVYLTEDLEIAQDLAETWDSGGNGSTDVWEVRVDPNKVTPDPESETENPEDAPWRMHHGPIHPSKIRLVGEDPPPTTKEAIAPRRPYYHVAPTDARESIEEHGLDHTKGESPWKGLNSVRPDWPEGNYLHGQEEHAKDYARHLVRKDIEEKPFDEGEIGYDIYKVDALGEHLERDYEDDDDEPYVKECPACGDPARSSGKFDPDCPRCEGRGFVDPDRWMTERPIPPERIKRVTSEEKVTLYRGTTEKSWNRAQQRGEFSHDPNWHTNVAREVEQHYGLPEGVIANHDYYQFNGDFRKTDNQLYVAGNPEDAARYAWSGNEPYEDALHTAHRIIHADLYDALDAKVDDDTYTKEDAQALKNHKEAFVQKYHEDTGTRPVVLKMEVPKSLAYPEPTCRGEVRHLKLTRPFPTSYVTDVTYPDRPKPFFSTKVGMATVPHDQLPDDLREHIESFKQYPAVQSLQEPAKAWYNCDDAAEDFYVHVKKRGGDPQVWTVKDRLPSGRTHVVNKIGDHFIDWTARQYHKDRDFPDVFEDPKDRRFQRSVQWQEGSLPDPDDARRDPSHAYFDHSEEFNQFKRELEESGKHPSWWRQGSRYARMEPGMSPADQAMFKRIRHQVWEGKDPQKLPEMEQQKCDEVSLQVHRATGHAEEFGEYWGPEVRPEPADVLGINPAEHWDQTKATGVSHNQGYGHWWNRKKDGTIIDASSDQFKKGEGVRVIPPDDPRQKDYWTETTDTKAANECTECDPEYKGKGNPHFQYVPWGRGHPFHDWYHNQKSSKVEPGISDDFYFSPDMPDHLRNRVLDMVPQVYANSPHRNACSGESALWSRALLKAGIQGQHHTGGFLDTANPTTKPGWYEEEELGWPPKNISHWEVGHDWLTLKDGDRQHIFDPTAGQFDKHTLGTPRRDESYQSAAHVDFDDKSDGCSACWSPHHTIDNCDAPERGLLAKRRQIAHRLDSPVFEDSHPTLYHVAPARFREDIREHGLHPSGEEIERGKAWAFDDVAHAHGWRNMVGKDEPHDIWKIDATVPGHDPNAPGEVGQIPDWEWIGENPHSHVLYGTGPEHLNLIHPAESPRQPGKTHLDGKDIDVDAEGFVTKEDGNVGRYEVQEAKLASWRNVRKIAMPRDENWLNEIDFYHTTRADSRQSITAWHPEVEMPVGHINWVDDGDGPYVSDIDVEPEYRRRGLGGELLSRARAKEPTLHHDTTLTPEGEALLDSKGDRAGGPVTASWRDVRNKAVRLRNANLVDIIRFDPDVIAARVQGDHHMYDVVLYRQYPDSWAITMWECSCKWGDWAFKRQITYVGRFCSHALATLYEAHGMEYKTGAVKMAHHVPKIDDPVVNKVRAFVKSRAPLTERGYKTAKNFHSSMSPDERADGQATLFGGVEMSHGPDVHPEHYAAMMLHELGHHADIFASEDYQPGLEAERAAWDKAKGYAKEVGVPWTDRMESFGKKALQTHIDGGAPEREEKTSPFGPPRPVCPDCKGEGYQRGHEYCDTCGGSGNVDLDETTGGWFAGVSHLSGLESENVDYPKNWKPNFSDVGKWQEGTLPTDYVRNIALRHEPSLQSNRGYRGEGQWDAFKDDIKQNGIKHQLLIYVNDPRDTENPALQIEGHHRLLAAHELGMPEVPVEVRYYGTAHMTKPDIFDEYRQKTGMAFRPNREYYKADWSELPDKLYHVAPASAHDSIMEHGLNPTGRTHNLALSEHDQAEGGHWQDDYYHGKGSGQYHYRPEGVYTFADRGEAALAATTFSERRGYNHHIWEVNVDSLRAHQKDPEHKTDVIRDPETFQSQWEDPDERTHDHPEDFWEDQRHAEGYNEEGEIDNRQFVFEKIHPKHLTRVKPYTLKDHEDWDDDDLDDYSEDHPEEDDDDDEQHHSSKTGGLGRGTLVFYGTSQPIKVDVEVARDAQSIQQGLMNRTFLGPRSGMAFVYPYPPSYAGFWMKNTLIPLSVAFWDREGRIIEIKDMQPCTSGDRCPTYECSKPYWGAVEVNLGFFRQWGIGPGTRVELHL